MVVVCSGRSYASEVQVLHLDEFIEATRVLKVIHRENMRTRLQQLESIDDPMLLKSLSEQHLTEENRKLHCIINYLSYWRDDAGKIGQASSA
jgi:hypothetical protein